MHMHRSGWRSAQHCASSWRPIAPLPRQRRCPQPQPRSAGLRARNVQTVAFEGSGAAASASEDGPDAASPATAAVSSFSATHAQATAEREQLLARIDALHGQFATNSALAAERRGELERELNDARAECARLASLLQHQPSAAGGGDLPRLEGELAALRTEAGRREEELRAERAARDAAEQSLRAAQEGLQVAESRTVEDLATAAERRHVAPSAGPQALREKASVSQAAPGTAADTSSADAAAVIEQLTEQVQRLQSDLHAAEDRQRVVGAQLQDALRAQAVAESAFAQAKTEGAALGAVELSKRRDAERAAEAALEEATSAQRARTALQHEFGEMQRALAAAGPAHEAALREASLSLASKDAEARSLADALAEARAAAAAATNTVGRAAA
jgi:hypothetical protein